MKTVTLSSKEFMSIPGYSTKRSVGQWKGDIDALLYDLPKNKVRVKRKGWLEEDGEERLALELEVTVPSSNVTRNMTFMLSPVLIMRKVHRNGKWESVPEEKASWKLFHDLLEVKLAGARLGVVEIQHEFMPYISKQLPDGRSGTMADVMDIALEADRLNEVGALEDKRERRIVETEVKVE